MNDNILKQAYSDIFKEIVKIIDFYHEKGASYNNLKKYFTKSRKNFEEILEDIKFKSINLFENENEYKSFVKKILIDILIDKDYAEKDKKTKNEMTRFKKFESFKLNERSENYMYVVYTEDGERHSAWDSTSEAKNQIRVLRDHGYKGCYYEYESVPEWVENGHYFV